MPCILAHSLTPPPALRGAWAISASPACRSCMCVVYYSIEFVKCVGTQLKHSELKARDNRATLRIFGAHLTPLLVYFSSNTYGILYVHTNVSIIKSNVCVRRTACGRYRGDCFSLRVCILIPFACNIHARRAVVVFCGLRKNCESRAVARWS